jgi:hypothetical protein
VPIFSRIGLRDVFKLANERKWRFGSFGAFGECKRFCIAREGVVIVTAFREVRGASLWMTPNSVFQNVVPYVTTASLPER